MAKIVIHKVLVLSISGVVVHSPHSGKWMNISNQRELFGEEYLNRNIVE